MASDVRKPARIFLLGMIALLLAINALNVVNSYVGRDFMTALVNRQSTDFFRLALLYVAVFAASTLVAAAQSYTQGRLGLLWRAWVTERLTNCYLQDRKYMRLRSLAGIDNPDERISEDVRAFTDSALGFMIMSLNGAITVIAFAGVTWSISPTLFCVCVAYAVLGSVGTILLGQRLAGLNGTQLAREADFRAALIHIRENAAQVAINREELPLHRRVKERLDRLVANFLNMLGLNFRLGLFTGGYNYLIQIIPALVVGPMYLRGDVEFGVVTQAAMAFAQLVGALSLVITQFGNVSSFAAVAARVNGLAEALENERDSHTSGIAIAEEPGRLRFEDLTLFVQEGHVLVRELTVAVGPGERLAIRGKNDLAQMALFRAAAGLWEDGTGRIVRPPRNDTIFIPHAPYMVPGTLRDQFRAFGDAALDDNRVYAALASSGLADLIKQVGGLDIEWDWDHSLTYGQQQCLALARVLFAKPTFAVIERLSRSLSSAAIEEFLDKMSAAGTGLIVFLGQDDAPDCCERTLEIRVDGSWSVDEDSRGSGERSSHVSQRAKTTA